MRLVLHKILSAFTTFPKKSTILGGTGPPGLPPPLDSRLNVSGSVKYQWN